MTQDMILEYSWSLPILTRCYTSWPTAIMTHSLQLRMSRSPCPNCVRWSSHSLGPHLAWLAESHSGHLLSSNNMHAARVNTLPPKKVTAAEGSTSRSEHIPYSVWMKNARKPTTLEPRCLSRWFSKRGCFRAKIASWSLCSAVIVWTTGAHLLTLLFPTHHQNASKTMLRHISNCGKKW